MIKALLLDVGNIIVRVDFKKTLQKLGLENQKIFENKEILNVFHEFEKGKIESIQFFEIVKKRFALSHDLEEIEDAWNDCLLEVLPDAVEAIRQLKKEIPLYALTNTNHTHYEYFTKKFPLFNQFSKIFSSHQLNCRKPEKIIYQKVHQDIHQNISVEPHEIFFVDDLYENIQAAREYGYTAEHCSDLKIRKILSEQGLLN